MFQKIYYEQYAEGNVRATTGRTITETDIVVHAGHTGDFFPHHMDAEWCKTQSFQQRMAHGTLVFSVAIGMAARLINEVAITYGYDKLRFIKPVFINDTITVKITIGEKKEYKKNGFGIVTEIVEVINQHNETVMVCSHLLLCEKQST